MCGIWKRIAWALALILALGAGRSAEAAVDLVLASGCLGTDECAVGGMGSNDGRVDPGETAMFDVNLRNLGDEDATNVIVTVVPLSLGVSMLDDTSIVGTVPAGGGGPGMSAIRYEVADTVACGTPLMFRIEIRSDQQDKDEPCNVVVPMDCRPCIAGASLALSGCQLISDACALGAGDADDLIDSGESIMIRIGAENLGGSDATNVMATVTSPTPGVDIVQGDSSLGTVPSGGGAAGMELIAFDVDLSVPCGTEIVLDVSFMSDQGDFLDSCSLPVALPCRPCTTGPVLTLTDCGPTDSCPLGGPGDADGRIDPGESISVALGVANSGATEATAVTATITSPTAGVNVTLGTTSFGTLMPGEDMRGDVDVVFELEPSVPCGTMIQLDVLIESDQGDAPQACTLSVANPCQVCTDQPVLVLSACDPQDSCAAGGPTDANSMVEPGEDVSMRVGLENLSPIDATNVVAVVSSSTLGVMITQDTVSFGTIPGFSPGMTLDAIEYSVAETVPCGTDLVFDIEVTSDSGVQDETCSIRVPAACAICDVMPADFMLTVAGREVVADACAEGGPGDGNGAPEPGESISLEIDVRNLGPSDATGVTATLVAVTPGVSVSQPTAALGDLASMATATSSPPFELDLSAVELACGAQLQLRVDFEAAEGVPPSQTITDLFVPLPCEPCVGASGYTAVHVASTLVSDSCPDGGPGHMDGSADPGETLGFEVEVMNLGPGSASNLSLSLVAVTPGVSVLTADSVVGNLASGASATAATPFVVRLDPDLVTCGQTLEFDLSFTADEGPSPVERFGDLAVAMPCNVCAGVLPDPPGEVQDLRLACDGSDLRITWMGLAEADSYRLYRGSLAALDRSLMPPYDHACIAGDLVAPLEQVVPGGCDGTENVYFLAVGVNDGGEGSYGLDDSTGDGVGDDERPAGTGPCP